MTATVAVIRRNTERAEGVRTQWQEVTPELATHWLEGNTHNRSVRDSVVHRYASDMKAGRWKQTHQGIAFDEDGTLIDGQHRLFAIIEANVPVVMQVTRGLPMDSQRVVDDGIRRTVADVMRVFDESMSGMTTLHVAVAERVYRGLSSHPEQRTRQEASAFLKTHWEAIEFAVGLFPMGKRVKGIASAPVLAVIARAFYHEDRALLTRFAKVLTDGMSTDAREFPVVRLRTWLMTRERTGGGQAQAEAYGKTARVLSLFAKGKDVGRNIVPVTEDPYPLKGTGKSRA